MSEFSIMSSREGGRRIKVEVRGLPETRHMLIPLERMRRVGDIATKLKYRCDDIKQTDEIKIYRDKFHIHDNENINIIKSDEEIIVYTKATETEYFEENEDNKETLLNVREKILEEREKNLEKKETEMRTKEEDIEALAKMKETELKEKIDDLQNRRDILKAKEKVLEKREEEFQLKEKDLRKKDKSLDLKIQEKEKAFSKLLTVKDELKEEIKEANLKLRKISQQQEVKKEEKKRLESLVISLQNSVSGIDSFWCPVPDPCPFIKRRKLDHLPHFETTRDHSYCAMFPPNSPPR